MCTGPGLVVDYRPVDEPMEPLEEPERVVARPLLPDYAGACISGIVPALLGPRGTRDLPGWFPVSAAGASQVVLLVLDGLGWLQLAERMGHAPALAELDGGPISTVVPSTTSTALTSIATGLTPGEHGVVGYRIEVRGEVLNVLRWSTAAGDARRRIPPELFQPVPAFLGSATPVVTRAEFDGSGFSLSHLRGSRHIGWRTLSTLIVEVRHQLAEQAPFIYAYYDGMDKVAHEYGLGEHYLGELRTVDRLVADLQAELPPGAVLLVTADHGQVDVGPQGIRPLGPGLPGLLRGQSGEGRFRWLHALAGAAPEVLAVAQEAHGDEAWVVPVEQIRDEGWLGPRLSPAAAGRLGDVALVARDPVSFDDPADSGPFVLIGRHGSVTPAEMLVPLLCGGPL